MLAVAAGLVVAAAVAALLGSGALPGRAALVLTALLVLAVPTSEELARRALVAGTVFLGWVPFLWWWDLPLGSVGRSGLTAALVGGGLAAWVALSDVAQRARRLVPRVRWADAVAAAGLLVAVWVYRPLLGATSGQVALSTFLRGWDNSAHFDMTEMIRTHGTLISRTAEGSAGPWSYGDYPQGFHAAAATVMEVLGGVERGAPSQEIALYMTAMAVVVLLSLGTVLAGLCALPWLRRRPLLALPLVVLVVATFTLGPGGMVLHNGFPNFYVACALLSCLPLVALALPRLTSAPLVAALGGAAVGVMHNWSFLMTMGAFAAVVALLPLRRGRWPRTRREWVVLAALGVATVVGAGAAALMLRSQAGVGSVLLLPGGVTPPPVSTLVLSVGVSIALCVAAGADLRGRGAGPGTSRHTRLRALGTVLLPGAGLAVAIAVTMLQVRATGDVGYYLWKYAIALQMLTIVVIAATVPLVVRAWRERRVLLRAAAVVGSVLAGVGVLQVYGLPAPLPTSLGGYVAQGGNARLDALALGRSPSADSAMVLAAADAHAEGPDVPHVLLPFPSSPAYPQPGGVPPMMLSQWFNALTGRWTERGNDLLRDLAVPEDQSVAEAVRAARAVLETDPDAVVVLGPDYVDAVRDDVRDEGWADRVSSW